jgi:hypothetical protein
MRWCCPSRRCRKGALWVARVAKCPRMACRSTAPNLVDSLAPHWHNHGVSSRFPRIGLLTLRLENVASHFVRLPFERFAFLFAVFISWDGVVIAIFSSFFWCWEDLVVTLDMADNVVEAALATVRRRRRRRTLPDIVGDSHNGPDVRDTPLMCRVSMALISPS